MLRAYKCITRINHSSTAVKGNSEAVAEIWSVRKKPNSHFMFWLFFSRFFFYAHIVIFEWEHEDFYHRAEVQKTCQRPHSGSKGAFLFTSFWNVKDFKGRLQTWVLVSYFRLLLSWRDKLWGYGAPSPLQRLVAEARYAVTLNRRIPLSSAGRITLYGDEV